MSKQLGLCITVGTV